MDGQIRPEEHRAIAELLAIVRLQSWLLQRDIAAKALDDTTLVARLDDIDRQTVRINELLHGLNAPEGASMKPADAAVPPNETC